MTFLNHIVFTCKIKYDSDRLMGLDVSYNSCKVLTAYGVYMPDNSGIASQTQSSIH